MRTREFGVRKNSTQYFYHDKNGNDNVKMGFMRKTTT